MCERVDPRERRVNSGDHSLEHHFPPSEWRCVFAPLVSKYFKKMNLRRYMGRTCCRLCTSTGACEVMAAIVLDVGRELHINRPSCRMSRLRIFQSRSGIALGEMAKAQLTTAVSTGSSSLKYTDQFFHNPIFVQI